jgi:hypothetical protein
MSKIVYLDQNKWIDISRAFYGRTDGEPFVPVLSKLQDKTKSGEVILPLSIMHIIETARGGNVERKKRLTDFMLGLSGAHGILPYISVRKEEIHNAISLHLGEPKTFDIPAIAFQKGIEHILNIDLSSEGIPTSLQALFKQSINNFDVVSDFIVNKFEKELTDDIKEENLDTVKIYEERRAELQKYSKDERRRIAVYEMGKHIAPEIINVLNERGLDVKAFVDSFGKEVDSADAWQAFFMSIPTIDLYINLHLIRDENIGRKIDKNDGSDIAFMAIAIPYCDVVVLERYWYSVLKAAKYDEKYNTTLLTDLRELENML